MAEVLEAEVTTYEASRAELVRTAEGRFVLIRKGDVVGTFDTKMDAINEGYRRFGHVPFLVRQITRTDEPVNLFPDLLGI